MSDLNTELEPHNRKPLIFWILSPVLLIFGALFFIPLFDAIEEERRIGVVASSLTIILCFSGFLTLLGVPYVSRVVTGIIAIASGYYLIDECLFNFPGYWGWGGARSSTSPINSIFAFLVFGLPCTLYTILGRFTFRREPDLDETEYEDYYGESVDDDLEHEDQKQN